MKRLGRMWALLAGCLALGLILALPHGQGRAEENMEFDSNEPTATALTVEEGAADEMSSLQDVLADKQPEDGSLWLDMDRLRAKFGCDGKAVLKVYAATWKGGYEECAVSTGGIVAIPAGNLYLRVELSSGEPMDKSNTCWAGVMVPPNAPQAKLYVESQEAQDGDEELVLDLSEVLEEYSSILVYSAREGKAVSQKDPDNGIVRLELEAKPGKDRRYVTILRKRRDDQTGETERYLWAGAFTYDPKQPVQRYAVRLLGEADPEPLVPDWSIVMEGKEVSLRFDDDEEPSKLRAKLIFLDDNGKALYDTEGVANAINLELLNGTALVKAQLLLDGAVLDEKQLKCDEPSAPTPSPSPESSAKPAPTLRLDSETVEIQDGKIAFSGTAALENGGEAAEWVLYVNNRPCEAEWTRNEDGSADFRVENFAANVGRLSISVCAADESTEFSEAAELEVQAPPARVTVEGWVGAYDGEPHAVTVKVLTGEQNVKTFFVPADDSETAPLEPAGGEEGLPQATDAGTLTAYVRVEAKNRRVVCVDADGNEQSAENGWTKVSIEIQPAAVTLSVRARQMEEAVYNGREQTLTLRFEASVEADPTGKFDLSAVTGDKRWSSETAVTGKAAGQYPVEIGKEQFRFIETIDPNYQVTVNCLPFEAEIRKKPVTLVSDSAVALYGEAETLTAGKVQGTDAFCEGDYYSSDARAVGRQEGVGASRNRIQLKDELNTDNYELSCEEGVLVIFPQSIDANAPAWSEGKEKIDPKQFVDEAEKLPGYYDGMSVKLNRAESDYDGSEKKPAVSFSRNGERVDLTSEDYAVRYLRGGEETSDLVNAGKIDVEITGIGNYAGTVTLPFEIRQAGVKNASVQLESWSYDGTAAGSARHQPQAADGARFVYRREAGNEIDPPADAGSYTVQAVWDADGNHAAAESERCEFVIRPAAVKVILNDRGDIERFEDSSGQFREEMLRPDGNTYVCTDDNFEVTLQWKGLRPGETPPSVALESWEYDGTAAGSVAHRPETEGAAEIHYLNAAGEEIDPPNSAGRYTIRAIWNLGSGETYADEQAFEISPRMATVYVCDAEKACGEEDPIFTAAVENLLEGDEVAYAIHREAGEDVGEYAIAASGDAFQGNYEMIFEPGTLRILPEDIAKTVFEWFDDAPTLSAPNGETLVEGKDYDLQIDERADSTADVTILGRGNYSGELSRTCAAAPLKVEVTVLGMNGEKTERLEADSEGRVSLSGELAANRPVQLQRLAVWIDGQDAEATIREQSDGVWTFEVTDFALGEKDAKTIEIAAAVNGSARGERTLSLLRREDARVGLYWVVGLSVAALIHLIGFVRLSRRLKKERLKLLDRVSRQSNRTLRDNRN